MEESIQEEAAESVVDESIPEEAAAETVEEPVQEEAAEPVDEQPEAVEQPDPVTHSATIEMLAVGEAEDISWTPYFVYLATWVALSVASVFLFRSAALDGGARWAPEYLYLVYAGIGMTALGPVLSLVVWLVTRARRAPEMRHGLFVSALVKGSVVTFIGAITWIVALYVLDLFTSGILV